MMILRVVMEMIWLGRRVGRDGGMVDDMRGMGCRER